MAIRSKFELDYDAPFVFETTFGNDDVYIGINYNEIGDFYTIDLYDAEFQPIIMGEKLVYGKRVWRRSVDPRVPAVDLIPMDESGKESTVAKANFGITVFLYIDTLVDETV
ncbi:phage baseplate plug family protein [Loigolactobacillus bifermentans]|jgi:hypothetical protein|uniref:Cyanophage baseplate Pam3 plug gp18 domain-containing protein n=1 Tax=Loigolactobacillus bifermentans DSM 20003 TaxID=1423726 RepID=A0A0R1H3L5_9LACO|nr:hypothetical protein [Loigolactobacillus bifermentans]KRK40792.1 hypothetical protein FC07_GL002541 [Loigolactobacillus bifermentans DSM 20003]QGG59545.1 hypothetical protein LB003_03095 [Loigolactobacillus bifermentans]